MLQDKCQSLLLINPFEWTDHTKEVYTGHLKAFAEFMGNIPLRLVSENDLDALRAFDPISDSTWAIRMKAIRALYRYYAPNHIPVMSYSAPTVEGIKSKPISAYDIGELINHLPKSYAAWRGKCGAALGLSGVRSSDLYYLEVDDIDLDYEVISSRHGLFTIRHVMKHAIAEYISVRRQKGSGLVALFTSVHGNAINNVWAPVKFTNDYLESVFAGEYTYRNLYTRYILDLAEECNYDIKWISKVANLPPNRVKQYLEVINNL